MLDSAALLTCPDGATVDAAGLVVMRQAPPTAKGTRFLTLEDERGFINVILHATVYEQHRRTIRNSRFLRVHGRVQQRGGVTNLVGARVMILSSNR